MRMEQKESIRVQIRGIVDIHDEIKDMLGEKRYGGVVERLRKCQEIAIVLGTMIESSEGDRCPTVLVLESYCESVYQLYEDINSGHLIDVEKVYDDLYTVTAQIENSVENDIKVQIEIVFFPYKASMWDSLESIWKAADEDPDCDAYVIPIPYYDKAPDGSFCEMHYESDQYPRHVPITHYNDYDLEGRHPDVVFIHNPYDDNNLATSVHPRFYSSALRKNTALLCYVPYFITMGGIGKHLCTVSACVYAEKIFLESERVRKIYVDSLIEDCGGHQDFFERKFEVLGSPKTDKIFALDPYIKEKNDMPKDKKVILFNTSVGGLLKDPEKWSDKLQKSLRILAREPGIILWWRPHPLTVATIKSMRPVFYKKYQEIVEDFIIHKMGIYDDSVDMYRAIAISDGYYGDRSSIVQLYGITGKPILLADISVETEYRALPADLEDIFQKKIYRINKKTNAKIHEFLLHEKDIPLSYFISYVTSQANKALYKERLEKQAYCYESSMVCNKGHSGERILRYIKNYLDEER